MKLGLSFELKGVNYRTTCYGDKDALANLIQFVQGSNALITYCNLVVERPNAENKYDDKAEEPCDSERDLPFTA